MVQERCETVISRVKLTLECSRIFKKLNDGTTILSVFYITNDAIHSKRYG